MAEQQGKVIKVTLVKSAIGYNKHQKQIVKALGLGKINKTVTLGDTPQIRGMVQKVIHLVSVEEVTE